MVVKKEVADDAAELIVQNTVETSRAEGVPSANKNPAKAPVEKAEAFCVYIGPSIRGVIQSGTVYPGAREKTLRFLAAAVDQYPMIAKLLVTDKTIAEDRIKVKTPGNLLYVDYHKLATGKK